MSVFTSQDASSFLPSVLKQEMNILMHGDLLFWEEDLSSFSQYERRAGQESDRNKSKVSAINRCERRHCGADHHVSLFA